MGFPPPIPPPPRRERRPVTVVEFILLGALVFGLLGLLSVVADMIVR